MDPEINSEIKFVKLSDLDFFYARVGDTGHDNWQYHDSARTNTGEYLNDCYLVDTGGYGSQVHSRDYLIDKKYSRITGTVFLDYNSRSDNGENYIYIWGDGNLIYKSGNVSSGFLPTNFEIDITNISDLKFGMENVDFFVQSKFGISNVILYRMSD